MNQKDFRALAGVVLFYVLLEAVGVTCPIRFLTGVSCAGCGMSRAWLAVVRGDISAALAFHPLFWLPVPGAALLLCPRIPQRTRRVGLALCGGLFCGVYLVRLCLPGEVVVFAPRSGLIWRLAARVLGRAV